MIYTFIDKYYFKHLIINRKYLNGTSWKGLQPCTKQEFSKMEFGFNLSQEEMNINKSLLFHNHIYSYIFYVYLFREFVGR